MPQYTFDTFILARVSSTGLPFTAILGGPTDNNVLLFDMFPGQIYDDLLRLQTFNQNPYPVQIHIAGSEPTADEFERAASELFRAGGPLAGFEAAPSPLTRSYWTGSYWLILPDPQNPNRQSFAYTLRNTTTGLDLTHSTTRIPDGSGTLHSVQLSFVLVVQTP